MRVVFMGSPEFAVPSLEALIAHHEVALVVTQTDKRAGRGKRMQPPPVADVARAAGIPVVQPRSARPPEFAAMLRDTGAELGVVVAYGKILPKAVLEAFPRGCINVHGSLLPKYRGAAPVQWAIIRGEAETGVTIMQLDEGMDTGPALLSRAMPIEPGDTAGSLMARMAPIGAQALIEAIARLPGTGASEPLVPVPQDDEQASYAPMLRKSDGAIDWRQTAREVANRIRGVDPWPGAETVFEGGPLKLFCPQVVADDGAGRAPGEVIGVDERGLVVACGAPGDDGGAREAIAIAALQAPGRRRLEARAFTSGRPIPPGTRLGPVDGGAATAGDATGATVRTSDTAVGGAS